MTIDPRAMRQIHECMLDLAMFLMWVKYIKYCYTAAGVFRSERMQRQLLQHTVNAYLMQIAYQCVHILQCVCISYICNYYSRLPDYCAISTPTVCNCNVAGKPDNIM